MDSEYIQYGSLCGRPSIWTIADSGTVPTPQRNFHLGRGADDLHITTSYEWLQRTADSEQEQRNLLILLLHTARTHLARTLPQSTMFDRLDRGRADWRLLDDLSPVVGLTLGDISLGRFLAFSFRQPLAVL